MARATGDSPTDVTRTLRGIDFPVNREDLVRHARRQGAERDVIDTLNRLPDQQYDTLAEVLEGYGRVNQEDIDGAFEVDVDDEDTEEVPPQRRRA